MIISRNRARRILLTQMAALALAAHLTTPAHALTRLEQGWQIANTECKGGDAKACDLRERLSAKLKGRGCAFQEDGGWWKCTRAH